MTAEPEYNSHYRCVYCHGLKAKADIIFVDDKPICTHGGCKDAYYRLTRPVPRSVGYYDKG